MKITGTAEDQLAIRLLIDRYSDACCQRDADALASLWAEDGRWGVADMPELGSEGKAEIVRKWAETTPKFSVLFLTCSPGYIEIAGDTAHVRTYTSEVVGTPKGGLRRCAGLYDDKLVKSNGEWLFKERVWSMIHSEGDLGEY